MAKIKNTSKINVGVFENETEIETDTNEIANHKEKRKTRK